LIQAFSRTNRVLNDTKPYGNILDFRSQQEAVNQALPYSQAKIMEKPKKFGWLTLHL
jgi:type I restriction enzyme R subunit